MKNYFLVLFVVFTGGVVMASQGKKKDIKCPMLLLSDLLTQKHDVKINYDKFSKIYADSANDIVIEKEKRTDDVQVFRVSPWRKPCVGDKQLIQVGDYRQVYAQCTEFGWGIHDTVTPYNDKHPEKFPCADYKAFLDQYLLKTGSNHIFFN